MESCFQLHFHYRLCFLLKKETSTHWEGNDPEYLGAIKIISYFSSYTSVKGFRIFRYCVTFVNTYDTSVCFFL